MHYFAQSPSILLIFFMHYFVQSLLIFFLYYFAQSLSIFFLHCFAQSIDLIVLVIVIVKYAFHQACFIGSFLANVIWSAWIVVVLWRRHWWNNTLNFMHQCKVNKQRDLSNFIKLCCVAWVPNVPCVWFDVEQGIKRLWKQGRWLGSHFLMMQYNDFRWIEHFKVMQNFVQQ
jgi:hypothetical protein